LRDGNRADHVCVPPTAVQVVALKAAIRCAARAGANLCERRLGEMRGGLRGQRTGVVKFNRTRRVPGTALGGGTGGARVDLASIRASGDNGLARDFRICRYTLTKSIACAKVHSQPLASSISRVGSVCQTVRACRFRADRAASGEGCVKRRIEDTCQVLVAFGVVEVDVTGGEPIANSSLIVDSGRGAVTACVVSSTGISADATEGTRSLSVGERRSGFATFPVQASWESPPATSRCVLLCSARCTAH